jgi:hypothetical protein
MKVEYNYKIVKVDQENKIMEILYTPLNSNLTECLVGAKLPYVGESLESIVQSFAPLGTWAEQHYEYETVEEGVQGTMTSDVNVLVTSQNLSEIDTEILNLSDPIELVNITP